MNKITESIPNLNIEYELFVVSTWVRKLKGTITENINSLVDMNVYINGAKSLSVDIINNDNNIITFELDLYLTEGINQLKIVCIDNDGMFYEKEEEITIYSNIRQYEKEILLENFIGNDDNQVSLHLGTSDLKYVNADVGLSKDVIIDTSINSHYFSLEGENAKLYRISKQNIPKIQGDIVAKPLTITFDYVEKIYDGNNDITSEIKKLKINDGYYFVDSGTTKNNFSMSGFVTGHRERRVTSETIFKKYDIVTNEYIINVNNIDYSEFYINIDGVEGYALLDESSGNAEIILQNNSLNQIFNSIELIRTETNSILKFNYIDTDEITYTVNSAIDIKYKYIDNSENNYLNYITSDNGFVDVSFSKGYFASKDVTDTVQRVSIQDIKLISGELGDKSHNYQIMNYTAYGKILKRTIYPHMSLINKFYDGSPIISYEINKEYYNGLQNVIEGDDISIKNAVFVVSDANIGNNKPVILNSLFIDGNDAKNYTIGDAVVNYWVTILPREITVNISEIRLIRSSRRWEIDYTIINDIKTDNLTISYNTNDNNDIKVYGGIDFNGNSIHKNYSNHPDILTMFFNYPFNNEYQFVDEDTEISLVENTKTHTAYWKNEARPAEPITERIDIEVETNTQYPGELKVSSNHVPYFESQNKEYRLYDGCKVTIDNVRLNSSNDKIKNYILNRSTYETTLKII